MQCLLQECTDFVIAVLAFLVEFYKEIGGCLQGLVYCPRVVAVDRQLLQPFDEAVEEREKLQRELQLAQAEVSQLRKVQNIRATCAQTQQQMIERLTEREQ